MPRISCVAISSSSTTLFHNVYSLIWIGFLLVYSYYSCYLWWLCYLFKQEPYIHKSQVLNAVLRPLINGLFNGENRFYHIISFLSIFFRNVDSSRTAWLGGGIYKQRWYHFISCGKCISSEDSRIRRLYWLHSFLAIVCIDFWWVLYSSWSLSWTFWFNLL